MKEIFPIDKEGPFKARVDERYHKLGHDCPADGWVSGYLIRDLHNGEILPHIFNCPCTWVVQEETIEPVGFQIAEWIKVEDALPEYEETVLVACFMDGEREITMRHRSNRECVQRDENDFAIIGDMKITHWMPIPKIMED